MKKLTPVIFVDRIEPVLPFWTERLGFTATVEVPEGDSLGFVILARDNVEVMYQSRASVTKDVPALAAEPFVSRANLFIEVENLQEFLPGLEGLQVTVPKRTTFYGALEFGVRAPCGTSVVLAEFQGQ
ncbi:MAG TPA: hypothetical protein VGP80_09595 [Gemmatimonadales bacterium]|jgi:hypothetical protein|nr:hypothetical protein [Gemmatimonadales bacterium]